MLFDVSKKIAKQQEENEKEKSKLKELHRQTTRNKRIGGLRREQIGHETIIRVDELIQLNRTIDADTQYELIQVIDSTIEWLFIRY